MHELVPLLTSSSAFICRSIIVGPGDGARQGMAWKPGFAAPGQKHPEAPSFKGPLPGFVMGVPEETILFPPSEADGLVQDGQGCCFCFCCGSTIGAHDKLQEFTQGMQDASGQLCLETRVECS